jgi:eukaryotic-like serine/threonine-protein kinase
MNQDPSATKQSHPEAETEASSGSPGDLDATVSSDSAAGVSESALVPKTIGPYKLLYRLGEGGMGQVWLAEQTAPVQREVAIKLIRFGVYDSERMQRFLSERQSLAIMDHPAIAKVFDAGATADGQPYFVMEYVPGAPITNYCDEKKLTLKQRLELFAKICEGVQHAHQKAIIHRDLKPPNILVAEVDGKPVPRIIDFGLAKAVGSEHLGESMTRAGHWVGTPGYMSPEQADSSADVDTRTDVYSLGVVLYVLLTGDQPFDLTGWEKESFFEVLRQLREVDPLKPSSKIRKQDPAIRSQVAENRRDQPDVLVSKLRGDLDCIVLKALEKDRNRRYATPLELAADVSRYLQNAPVSAHPPGVAYRAQKYVRRNRIVVVACAGGLLLLVGFAVTQSIELRQIRRQRDRADRISRFMTGIFKVPNPSEARGSTVTAREILDQASHQIGTTLNKDPELQAQLLDTMSQTYTGLGLYGRAQDLAKQTLSTQRSLFGEHSRQALAAQSYLAQLYRAQGHLPEAEKLLQSTIETQRKVLGPSDPDTLVSMDRLAYVFTNEGRHAESEAMLRQTLDAEKRVLGRDDPRTLNTLTEFAEILTPQGRYADADKVYVELIAAQRRTLGPDHPATLLSMSHAAENLEEEGRYPEAEKIYADVIDAQGRVLGPDHPQRLRAMMMLAMTMMKEKRYAEADALQEKVIEAKTRVLGPTHPSTLQSMEMKAIGLSREDRYAESGKLFHDVIDTATKNNQPATVAEAWYNFACSEAARGKPDEAFSDLERAIEGGLISPGELSSDPELNPLRGDPRFDAIIAKAVVTSSPKQKQ